MNASVSELVAIGSGDASFEPNKQQAINSLWPSDAI